ncbi:M28 family peptidase [Verrucomicrobiota bacterium]
MPGKSYAGPLPPLTTVESELAGCLEGHVVTLAETIGERNVRLPEALEAAAGYIEKQWAEAGLASHPQHFDCRGVPVRNLAVEIPGSDEPGEIVLIGAHYDSVMGSPGANDNGSGVAVLLELSRLFASRPAGRTLRFVAFVNEEPPFFQGPEMGSLVYARAARARGDRLAAMLSLETMGCYADAQRSQQYPFPFSLFYPDTGNFIGFVGNMSSGRLVRRCTGSFRSHASFPSEGAAVPGWITGVGWSDHWSFWQEGYQALMVTDTAPFRYAHYHSPLDTPDRLDYARLARVTRGLECVIGDLAGGAVSP